MHAADPWPHLSDKWQPRERTWQLPLLLHRTWSFGPTYATSILLADSTASSGRI